MLRDDSFFTKVILLKVRRCIMNTKITRLRAFNKIIFLAKILNLNFNFNVFSMFSSMFSLYS